MLLISTCEEVLVLTILGVVLSAGSGDILEKEAMGGLFVRAYTVWLWTALWWLASS
jgi:hypothetical protein